METEARQPQAMAGVGDQTRGTALETTLSSGSPLKKEGEVRSYTEVVAEYWDWFKMNTFKGRGRGAIHEREVENTMERGQMMA